MFWILFGAGVFIRCLALTQPLVDAHLLRQCQTAAATQDLMAEPAISVRIPWAGDLEERYVLEFPAYNYLVIAAHTLVADLAVAGKLVSITLWALSFWLLQFIWKRALDPAAASWANLLFVVAPLGVFFAQAFVPEMLVQALAFAFLLLIIRYDENQTLGRWVAAAATGLFALMIKAPETAHLYLLIVAFVVRRAGWLALFRTRYVVAGIVSAAGVFAWSRYLNSVNVSSYSFGGAGANIAGFIGPLSLRFNLRPWLMIAMYLGAFVVPGPVILAVLQGARTLIERPVFLLGAWLGATAFFYVLWLRGAAAVQSYYNLPALAPLCALSGIGLSSLLANRSYMVQAVAAGLVVACAVPGGVYLFRPDCTILSAAQWTRDHTEPGSIILVHAAHRADMEDYGANAVFPFYAERPTFIWARSMPLAIREASLERSRYAVVTFSQPEGKILTAIRKLRGMPNPPRPSLDWLIARGFAPVAEDVAFVVLRRQ